MLVPVFALVKSKALAFLGINIRYLYFHLSTLCSLTEIAIVLIFGKLVDDVPEQPSIKTLRMVYGNELLNRMRNRTTSDKTEKSRQSHNKGSSGVSRLSK